MESHALCFDPRAHLSNGEFSRQLSNLAVYAQAAEKLNKSQSSLNHAVAKLQQDSGGRIAGSAWSQAFLTEEGEVFLRRAKQLTQQMEELELLAFNIHQGWEAEDPASPSNLSPRPLINRALQLYYPKSRGTQLQLIDTVLTGSQDAILEQQADLMITGHVPKRFPRRTLGRNHPVTRLSSSASAGQNYHRPGAGGSEPGIADRHQGYR